MPGGIDYLLQRLQIKGVVVERFGWNLLHVAVENIHVATVPSLRRSIHDDIGSAPATRSLSTVPGRRVASLALCPERETSVGRNSRHLVRIDVPRRVREPLELAEFEQTVLVGTKHAKVLRIQEVESSE